jgi:hypothetical protein
MDLQHYNEVVLIYTFPEFREDLVWAIRQLDTGKGAEIRDVQEILRRKMIFPEPISQGIRELQEVGLAYQPLPGKISVIRNLGAIA